MPSYLVAYSVQLYEIMQPCKQTNLSPCRISIEHCRQRPEEHEGEQRMGALADWVPNFSQVLMQLYGHILQLRLEDSSPTDANASKCRAG